MTLNRITDACRTVISKGQMRPTSPFSGKAATNAPICLLDGTYCDRDALLGRKQVAVGKLMTWIAEQRQAHRRQA